ncbi:hypothetical protein J5N97_022109 [Dioscorea zingiberensis]|uniref:CID domain-containing protein n=1 Tax=Dioscorea zingiberensis TaxID=325984 RepID=A0A9D5C9W2_9LILI|nr:hypothetical protein J5N97_022109 [Dioscorea zingiberensis]
MDGSFNGQILVDKLSKLNNSQQSIETLSHWCIFHRKKAKQVVETWDHQFYLSPRDQRVSFLYLANDILQNSRRRGIEYVTEFWKVLPSALKDVVKNGDDFGRNAAMRMVDIWEDRKVFGSRSEFLKEELLGINLKGQNLRGGNYKPQKYPPGEMLQKIICSFEHVQNGSVGEAILFGKCERAINSCEKVGNEINSDLDSALPNESGFTELRETHAVLQECIEQLKSAESARANLLCQLKEAMNEQESKMEQIRNHLQAAQSGCMQIDNIRQYFLSRDSDGPPGYVPEARTVTEASEQSTGGMYIQKGTFSDDTTPHQSEEMPMTTAAPTASEKHPSTSSPHMHQEQAVNEELSENKKLKTTPPPPPPPLPPFPHPEQMLPPPPVPPPPPPYHPLSTTITPTTTTQFGQAVGPISGVTFSYALVPLQRPPAMPSFPLLNMPTFPALPNPYQGFQAPESPGLFNQSLVTPSVPPVPSTPPPMSRPLS